MNRRLFAVFGVLLLPGVSLACLWDYDTLAMERARFPSTLELITGKFLRHSPEFYQWRVNDRTAKLEKDPSNLAYMDDLAVAYDKLGQDGKAIELMKKKEQLNPGQYETAANLGTFYLHSGKMAEGIEWLEKAMTINPDAHFGREKYQLRLAKYLRTRSSAPVDTDQPSPVFVALIGSGQRLPEEHKAAVKGVLGMMKFGKYDSPVLLEALGDLLSVDHGGMRDKHPEEDARRLATRAYLMASYHGCDWCRKKADSLLMDYYWIQDEQNNGDWLLLEPFEKQFKQQLAEADSWYEDLRQKEIGWIRDGKDPEAEFDKLYSEEPLVSGEIGPDNSAWVHWRVRWGGFVMIGGAILVGVLFVTSAIWFAFRYYRRWSRVA